MKKLIYLVSLLCLLVVTLVIQPVSAAPLADTKTFTFANLGLKADIVLHGPYDSNSLRFELPPTWELQDGVELKLGISAFATGGESTSSSNDLGAALDVYFNDKLQQSIPLQNGTGLLYSIPISADALALPSGTGQYKISFFLNAALDCDIQFHQTTVSINVSSEVSLPYVEKKLDMDLRQLPWPIYQENGVEKSSAVVVLPESATADELQAGLTVAGALGRMTSGNLPVTLVTNDQLTDDLRNTSNIILVGKPSGFQALNGITLPVAKVGEKYSFSGLNDEDGVLQAVASPWNSSKVLLVVSGNTDQGVVKAAQALSTSNLQTGDSADYSIVATVNPITMTGVLSYEGIPVASTDALFSDLGYDAVTATGIGTNWLTYEFIIPAGQTAGEGPYIDIKYSASDLVDENRSGGVVYLNDVLIGNLKLSSSDSNIITSRINLPASALKSGVNTLDLVFTMLPLDECSLFALSGLWVSVFPDSVLHLPLVEAKAAAVSLQDIKAYPFPFANDPALSTTAFILSSQDHASWQMAGRIAYDLGARVTGPILGFEVAYSDQLPDDIRTRNLIVVGEPKNMKIVADFKGVMPAHFEADSNIAVLEAQQVVYRISENKKLGYLELFTSPWNDAGVVLGIFGTSTDGLAFAGNSLLNSDSRSLLSGNFATLDGTKAVVVDTRTGLGLGRFESNLGPSVVSQQNTTVDATGADQVQIEVARGRTLILVGIGLIVVVMAAVIVLALRWRASNK